MSPGFNNHLKKAGADDCLIALEHLRGRLQVGVDRFTTELIDFLDHEIKEGLESEAEVLISDRLDRLKSRREACDKTFDQGHYEGAEKLYRLYLGQIRKGADPAADKRHGIALTKTSFQRRKVSIRSNIGKAVLVLVVIFLIIHWVNGNRFDSNADRLQDMRTSPPRLEEWGDYHGKMSGYESFIQGVLLNGDQEDRLKKILPEIELHISCKTEMNRVESLNSTGAYAKAEEAFSRIKKKYPDIYRPHSEDLPLSDLVLNDAPVDVEVIYANDGVPFKIFEVKKGEGHTHSAIGEGLRLVTYNTPVPGKKILPQDINVVRDGKKFLEIKILNGAAIHFRGSDPSIKVYNDRGVEIGRVGNPVDDQKGGYNDFFLRKPGLVEQRFHKYLTVGETLDVDVGEPEFTHGQIKFIGDPNIIIKDSEGVEVAKGGELREFPRGPKIFVYTKKDHEEVTKEVVVKPGVETETDLPVLESKFGDILIRDDENWKIKDATTGATVGEVNKELKRQRTGEERQYRVVNDEHPNGVPITFQVLPGSNNPIQLDGLFRTVGKVTIGLQISDPASGAVPGFGQWQYRLNDGNWEEAEGISVTRELAFGTYKLEALIPDFMRTESSFKLALRKPELNLKLDLVPEPIRIPVTCSPGNAKIRYENKDWISGAGVPLRPYANNVISFIADGYDTLSTNFVFSPHERKDFNVTMTAKEHWKIDAIRYSDDTGVFNDRIEIGISTPKKMERIPLDLTIVIDDPVRSNKANRTRILHAAAAMLLKLQVKDQFRVFVSGRGAEDFSSHYEAVTSDKRNIQDLRNKLHDVSGKSTMKKNGFRPGTYDTYRAIRRAFDLTRTGGAPRPGAMPVLIVMLNHGRGEIPKIKNTNDLVGRNGGRYYCRRIVFSSRLESEISGLKDPTNSDLFNHQNGPLLVCPDSDPKRLERYAMELVNIYAKNLKFEVLTANQGTSADKPRIELGYNPYLSTESASAFFYSTDRPSKGFRIKCNWKTDKDPDGILPYEFEYRPDEYKPGRPE